MPMITLTPVIGVVSRDRLASLSGCHAIHEGSVTKRFELDTMGESFAEALREIVLAEAAKRRGVTAADVKVLVTFR